MGSEVGNEELGRRDVELPLHVECPNCSVGFPVRAPLEWFASKLMLARIEQKLDALAARHGLIKPQSKEIGGYAVARGRVEKIVCDKCAAGLEGDWAIDRDYVVDLAKRCGVCRTKTPSAELRRVYQ